MRETYGHYSLNDFLDDLHNETRLIISISYDFKYNAWLVTVVPFKSKVQSKFIQLKLF